MPAKRPVSESPTDSEEIGEQSASDPTHLKGLLRELHNAWAEYADWRADSTVGIANNPFYWTRIEAAQGAVESLFTRLQARLEAERLKNQNRLEWIAENEKLRADLERLRKDQLTPEEARLILEHLRTGDGGKPYREVFAKLVRLRSLSLQEDPK